MIWYLYVIRTTDNFLYTGVTTDVAHRFAEHMAQGRKAAKYLRAHKPKSLVFYLAIGSRSLSLKVEYRFKKLSKRAKEQVVRRQLLHFDKITGALLTS